MSTLVVTKPEKCQLIQPPTTIMGTIEVMLPCTHTDAYSYFFSCICFLGGGVFKSNKTNEYEKDEERVGELEIFKEKRERGLKKRKR